MLSWLERGAYNAEVAGSTPAENVKVVLCGKVKCVVHKLLQRARSSHIVERVGCLALSKKNIILEVLDEPTSAMSPDHQDMFFSTWKDMVLFIKNYSLAPGQGAACMRMPRPRSR